MRLWTALVLASVLALSAGAETTARERALEFFAEAVELRQKLDHLPDAERTAPVYQKVVNAFRRVYRTTPQSSKADDSLAAEAELYADMTRRFDPAYHKKAIDTWRFLIAQYPQSPLLPAARQKLGELENASPAAQSPDPQILKSSNPLPLVSDLRHWSQPDLTRIVVDLESDVAARPERLTNPDRIFFDLPRTRLHPSLKNKTVPVGDDRVRQIRIAQTQIGVTRVVVDLAADADYTISTLPNPPRIVMELKPRSREATAASQHPSADRAAATASSAGPSRAKQVLQPPSSDRAAGTATPSANSQILKSPNPKPAQLPRREQNLIRALGLKISRVVIDAGHGGHDTGTIGPTGLMEKDLALDIATRLGALISDRIGSEVLFTRSSDEFVPLEERTALANEKQADLFLSIHANSSRLPTARGIETYYLNFTADREAQEVAARENAAFNKSIHDLQDLVTKITLTEKIAESREFAAHVQRSLHSSMARENASLRNRGVRKAPFVVLIGARMPSVLAEISFLSNPRDEKLLKTPAYRQKVAESLFQGIAGYARSLSRVEVAAR